MNLARLDLLRPDASPVAVAGATKVDVAYEQVRRWILAGDIAPGAVLDQGLLSAAVGVSTTPMREALRRLEAEDLLRIQAHRRVVVAPLSQRELDDIYAVRFELDPLAAFLSAEHISDQAIDGLRPLTDDRGGAVTQRLADNRQFHRTIYEASGNAVLIRILDSLHDRATRYRMILVRSDVNAEVAHAEHRAMLDALIRRDGETLARLTRAHLVAAKETITASLPGPV